MYLKPESYSYRRRRRGSSFWRILVLLVLIVGGVYVIFRLQHEDAGELVGLTTAVPLPTPTRSAVSFAAEAADFYRAGRITEAVAAYQEALDLEPDQVEPYLTLAHLSTFRGRPERGLALAREVLRFDPENARALALVGMTYDWLGMPDRAAEICNRAISLDPTLPEGYAYLAEAYVDQGNWLGANNTIETALELDGNNINVLRNYGYILEVQGNYTGAIEAYRKGLAQHPYLSYLYVAIGRNQQALGDIEGAKESYQAAVDSDPQSPVALDMLGWTYMLEGDYDSAQRAFEQAIEIDRTYSRGLGHLGSLLFQNRNYEDAIPTFEEAIRYGEAETRQQVIFFRVTLETAGQLPDVPSDQEVVSGEFVHPVNPLNPLRTVLAGEEDYAALSGDVRLDPLDGRYRVRLKGLPAPPAGQAYVGWFAPLSTAEGLPVQTESLIPDPGGMVDVSGITGPVKGPPIEYYYTLALCHYFLDQCDDARPYIDVALRIDPDDANALQTLQLCGG